MKLDKSGGSKYAFDYADVSADPDAPLWADVHPDVLIDVLRLGFRHLGYAHAWQRERRVHLVHQILLSPDGRTQAVLGGPDPSLELVTLFEDGAIVKTMLRPERAMWLFLAPGMRDHRADRHFVEAVRGSAAMVLTRHEARIAAHPSESKRQPVLVDSMCAHFAIRLRSAELLLARFPAHFAIATTCGALGSATVALAALRRVWPPGVKVLPSIKLLLLILVAACIASVLAYQVSVWWIAPFLVRLRPGPPAVPADELLARAGSVEARPLPGEAEW